MKVHKLQQWRYYVLEHNEAALTPKIGQRNILGSKSRNLNSQHIPSINEQRDLFIHVKKYIAFGPVYYSYYMNIHETKKNVIESSICQHHDDINNIMISLDWHGCIIKYFL